MSERRFIAEPLFCLIKFIQWIVIRAKIRRFRDCDFLNLVSLYLDDILAVVTAAWIMPVTFTQVSLA